MAHLLLQYNFQVMPSRLRSQYPTMSPQGRELLQRLLCYDPKKACFRLSVAAKGIAHDIQQRISAEQALAHDYFKASPLPTPREFFPTYPAKSELNKVPRKRMDSNGEDDGEYSVTEASLSPGVFGPAGFTLKF